MDDLKRVTKKNRQPIYVSEPLRKFLAGRKEPLSKAVSVLAERYIGVVERASGVPEYCLNWAMYEAVVKEVGRPLTPNEIATFGAMCKDWLARNPGEPQEPNKTAINEAFADAKELPNWLVRTVPHDVVTARKS